MGSRCQAETPIRGAILAAALALGSSGCGGSPVGPSGPVPQPIAFPHDVHSGTYGMSCHYCHYTARSSWSAGVPPVEMCMGCHKVVAAGKPEVVKLAGYWERKESIPWIRLHDLPDFVHFKHDRHVAAGVPCQTCHGEVQEMRVVERVAPLTMGWCVACHDQRGASNDCAACHY